MDISKKQLALLYVEKNKGTLYVGGIDSPFVIDFPKAVVSHLEVTDKSTFEQAITTFITQNEVKPTTIFIVLSKDVTFEKELENVPLSLQTEETEKFLEMVPFHHILTKTYNFSNRTIIVAANKNFCEDIISAFKENLFSVGGIMPVSIFEEKLPFLKEHFDTKFALKKIGTLRQYFLPLGIEHSDKLLTYEVPSLKNIQFVVLISIFTLLFVILGVQVYTQILKPETNPSSIKTTILEKVTPTPEASSSAALIHSPTPVE